MKLPRRQFLQFVAGAAALPGVARVASALDYPTRPVRLIVGFPPGGPTDIFARLIADWLSKRLGQPFVVENRPGAGSTIGVEAVVTAPADGYTLLLISTSAVISGVLLSKSQFRSDPRHRPRLRRFARAHGDGGQSSGPGQNRSRIHCLRKSRPRQDRHGFSRQWHHAAKWPANCSS